MNSPIRITAGPHPRAGSPVRVPWPAVESPTSLRCGGAVVPAQRDGDLLVFVPAPLQANEEALYEPADGPFRQAVRLDDDGASVLVELNKHELTTYHYGEVSARPYFWPVNAPGQVSATRAWPMREDVAGETHDHPHHRSMYVAFGAVNGADNWSEEPGHGFTVHRSVDELVSGPVFGRLSTTSDWTDADRKPVLAQRLTATFWGDSVQANTIDINVRLEAAYGDVLFGDTKEGGILTVRVASEMDVPRGGRIENSYGGIDEGETWGRAAHWCDYSGVVNGHRVGIAVMDHPESFRYPTYWHVRNYGLMAANPFALGDYTRGVKNGAHLLKAGDSLLFRYRVLVHSGDARTADVRGRYLDWVSPPTTALVEDG